MSITKKKIQVDKNGREYILFRIDLLVVEIDEIHHGNRDLIFKEKRQEALEKKTNCEFIKINTGKHYDEDYETGRLQSFVSEFKDIQLKKLEKESNKKIKELEDKIKELKLQMASQTSQ